MTIYQVIHCYDVDGGSGDAVDKSDVIATFENRDDAEAVCEKYSCTHVYKKPYDFLTRGTLFVREFEIVSHAEFDLDKIGARIPWSAEEARQYRIDCLKDDWSFFREIPLDESGRIAEEYEMWFNQELYDAGTPVSEIEAVFEGNYPGGLAALRKEYEGVLKNE